MMTSKKSSMKPKLKIPLHFNNNKHNGHHHGLPPLSPNSDILANSVGAFPTTSFTSNNDNPRRTKSSEVIITPSPQSTTTNKNSSKRSLSNNDVGIPSLFSKTTPKQKQKQKQKQQQFSYSSNNSITQRSSSSGLSDVNNSSDHDASNSGSNIEYSIHPMESVDDMLDMSEVHERDTSFLDEDEDSDNSLAPAAVGDEHVKADGEDANSIIAMNNEQKQDGDEDFPNVGIADNKGDEIVESPNTFTEDNSSTEEDGAGWTSDSSDRDYYNQDYYFSGSQQGSQNHSGDDDDNEDALLNSKGTDANYDSSNFGDMMSSLPADILGDIGEARKLVLSGKEMEKLTSPDVNTPRESGELYEEEDEDEGEYVKNNLAPSYSDAADENEKTNMGESSTRTTSIPQEDAALNNNEEEDDIALPPQNVRTSSSDFASMLKQAGTKLKHQDDEHVVEEDSSKPDSHYVRDPEEAHTKKLSAALSTDYDDRVGNELNTPHSHHEHKTMMSNIHKLSAMSSPEDEGSFSQTYSPTSGPSPICTPDAVKKIIKDNQKLRKRKKELLTLLSSTAQQFSTYERVCSQKICRLESENKRLASKKSPRRINREVQLARQASQEIEELLANKEAVKMYDGEVVRKLSNGVLKQEKQIVSKDELITQLKLRCEVLKQSLLDRDGEILQEKKLWENEKSNLLKKLDSSSPVKLNHGELLSKKMEITRLKKELETALSDITMLTGALETNNVALDAAVLELDKMKEIKAGNGVAVSRTTDKLKKELKEKENETAQLQKDLESALADIDQLRESVTAAAAAKGYDDFQNVVDDLKIESKAYKSDADAAKEELAQLQSELEEKNSKITELRVQLIQADVPCDGSTAGDADDNGSATDNVAAALNGDQSAGANKRQSSGRSSLLNNIRLGFSHKPSPEEAAHLQTMVRQRDLKIKSLEAMIHSTSRIMEKLKLDVERMDNEKEEAEYIAAEKIEKLTEENKTFELQVAGFEKAFMNLNERTLSGGHTDMERSISDAFKQDNNGDIADDNMFMSDDQDQDSGEGDNKVVKELREKNQALERMLSEIQSSSSNQEDQVEALRAELIKLRVKSQQEKESAIAALVEENKIVMAQRSALEYQLMEINKSAGELRTSPTDHSTLDGESYEVAAGSDPILITKVVRLENANKVLESSVESLRSDKEAKLTPLLERIALLEEEKSIIEEEMTTKLSLKEMTIANLENSLKQLQHHAKKSPKRRASKHSEEVEI